MRRALLRYSFNTKQRADPPEDVADVLAWLAPNTAPLSALAEPAVARRMLDQATGRLDGKNAAASTARRHRTILANSMDYAIELGLTAAEQASPLARRPYDLRHACLSTWLNGGVYPAQVADWAGTSVDVLLRIYAKSAVGQDELAKRRISDALRQD